MMDYQAEAKRLLPWDVEELSSILHGIYQKEAHRRGDVRHADRYEDLSEETKEWDRVLARWILELRPAVAAALQAAAGEYDKLKQITHDLQNDAARKDTELAQLRAEIAKLTAERDELKKLATPLSGPILTFCPECGINIAVDEEGCCVSCGVGAIGRAIDFLNRHVDAAVVQGLEIAYKLNRRTAIAAEIAKLTSHCGTCDGSGVVDSGGVTPWDAPVDMACPECKAKRDAAVVEGLEIAAKIFQYHRHRLRGVSADAFAICADMRDAIAAEIAKRKEPA